LFSFPYVSITRLTYQSKYPHLLLCRPAELLVLPLNMRVHMYIFDHISLTSNRNRYNLVPFSHGYTRRTHIFIMRKISWRKKREIWEKKLLYWVKIMMMENWCTDLN